MNILFVSDSNVPLSTSPWQLMSILTRSHRLEYSGVRLDSEVCFVHRLCLWLVFEILTLYPSWDCLVSLLCRVVVIRRRGTNYVCSRGLTFGAPDRTRNSIRKRGVNVKSAFYKNVATRTCKRKARAADGEADKR